MTETLKPCPFCGGNPVPDFCSSTDGPAYSFHCQSNDCPAWPNVQGETEAEAITAWNTRPTPDMGNPISLAAPLTDAALVEAVSKAICEAAGDGLWEEWLPMGEAALAVAIPAIRAGIAEAIEPFACLSKCILAEATPEAENVVLFSDFEGNAHTVSLDSMRRITTLAQQIREGKL